MEIIELHPSNSQVARLKKYDHNDSELERFSEKLETYVGGYNARKVPYWVFMEDEELVGVVVVGNEPLRMIEPVGTLASIAFYANLKFPAEILNELITQALTLAKQEEAAYSFIDLPSDQTDLIDYAVSVGYNAIEQSYRMKRDLDRTFEYDGDLRFRSVKRSELDDFFDTMKEFMSGSPDRMLNIVLGNLQNVPEAFLDHWFEQESLYYAFDGNELVGFLDLSPQYLNIANIGVAPNHRGKGYGKQMMQYALMTLREMGKEHAALRVHSKNVHAISLYESAGLRKDQERTALLWRK
jgi:ribosomal protein S18 acetylase RimI-like enzyme